MNMKSVDSAYKMILETIMLFIQLWKHTKIQLVICTKKQRS